MTDTIALPRATVKKVLEALECVDLQSLVPDYGSGHYSVARFDGPQVKSAITALKAALEEPVQEPDRWGAGYEAGYAAGMAEMKPEQVPVAWMFQHGETGSINFVVNYGMMAADEFIKVNPRYTLIGPLYTIPPQRLTAGDNYSDIVSDGGMDPRN